MKTKLLTGLLVLCLAFGARSQTVTNVGTDFWIAFPPNFSGWTIKLLISSNYTTSGTVQSAYPGVDQNFTVVPGVVTQLTLPDGVSLLGGIEDKGIHVTSADPISLYGHNWRNASTDAYLALPLNALGTDYRVLTYKNTGTGNQSHFTVVATEDNTTVLIDNAYTGLDTTIVLNQGQVFMDMEEVGLDEDVTGSRIQSDHPVAVFGSVTCVNIPQQSCPACDHIVEMMFPYYSWGKNFVTVPLAGRDESGDVFRILSGDDDNVITINGSVVATLDSGQFYQTELPGYNVFNSSKAALLAQFAKGISCSGNLTGDPFMMLIPPCEQFLTNYTILNVTGFTSHWVNVVAPDYAIGTIYQDGVLIPAGAFTQIGTSAFYGAQRSVSEDSHVFTSIYPFGVFVYGWNMADSYGYPGGGSLSPVGTVHHVALTPDTSYGQLNVTTVCLTATVTDNLANPVEGVLVNFNITGVSTMVGNAYTDALGKAQYCYMQSGVTPGMDQVYAEVFGVLSDTAVVFWSYIPPCTNPTTGGSVGNDQSGCGTFTPAPLVSLLLPSGESGTLEYLWQWSTTSGLTGFTDIPGSNAAGYAPGMISQTTWYRRLARVDCMSGWTGAVVSNAVELTVVVPLPVSVSISSTPSPYCMGSPVTFTASPVNGGPSPGFQWKVNGSNTGANSPTFVVSPENGDQVACIMTSSLPCVSGNPALSNTLLMTGNPVPVVTFTACFDTLTTTLAKPVKLKGGIPLGGTYSGPGVSGGYFYPNLAGPGIHIITYTYNNTALCSASSISRFHNFAILPFVCASNLTDIRDGKVYPTIQIGTQCWMAADLNYGVEILPAIHQRDNCINEKYFNPASSIQHPASVYQWDELMRYDETPGLQGLCPPGWHVPTTTDWNTLFANWTNNGFAGSPLKYSGYSGFNAQLTGVMHQNVQWDFLNFAILFWSSTSQGEFKAWAHGMNEYNPSVSRYPSMRSNAFPVRCLRD